jgi:uncharacterized protein YbjT (DUF2867 family)
MSKSPVVAVIGANGYIGRLVVPTLYEALNDKRISELRILSRKVSADDEKTASANGAAMHQITYSDPETLVKALTGVDVLISTPPQQLTQT